MKKVIETELSIELRRKVIDLCVQMGLSSLNRVLSTVEGDGEKLKELRTQLLLIENDLQESLEDFSAVCRANLTTLSD